MNRYSIQIQPFVNGCHFAVVGSSGFNWAGGCRSSVFEAVASAFSAARKLSRAKRFSVVVL